MAAKAKSTEKPKPKDDTQDKQEDQVTCPVCAYQFKPGDPRL